MRNKIFAIFFFVPLVILSCKKEQVDSQLTPIVVTGQDISATIGTNAMNFENTRPHLKTAFFQLTDGTGEVRWITTPTVDAIGIFAVNSSAPTLDYAKNAKYVAQTNNSVKSAFLGDPTNITLTGTAPHDFYAYYPHNTENTSASISHTNVTVQLPTPQSQSQATTTHLGLYDYEIAKASTTTGTVSFIFRHIFSIVRFRFLNSKDNEVHYIQSITLTSDASSPILNLNLSKGSINLENSPADFTYPPANGTRSTVLNITGGTTPFIGLPVTSKTVYSDAYMVVLPGNYAVGTNNMTIAITAVKKNGSQNVATITVPNLIKTGKLFTPGNIYDVLMPAL